MPQQSPLRCASSSPVRCLVDTEWRLLAGHEPPALMCVRINRHEHFLLAARYLAGCVAAPNIDPFRLPTLTPAQRPNSKWIQALTACQTGSILDAGWGSKAAPIDRFSAAKASMDATLSAAMLY